MAQLTPHLVQQKHVRRLRQSCVAALIFFSASTLAACPPDGYALTDLQTLKTHEWQITDTQLRQQLALALSDCLSNTDPTLRDEIAFEALSHWMRNSLLSPTTLQQLRQQLLHRIRTPMPTTDPGFAQPFAALVLAEIARVDRLQAWMTAEQRQEMLDAASEYLPAIRDFRGFDEQQGWRHGVAHGADWLLQLALNPAFNETQHSQILRALAPQIRNDQHFYHYGESARLMAPVYYISLRSRLSFDEWEQWLDSLTMTSVNAPSNTQAKLARKHNLIGFFQALYINLQETPSTPMRDKLITLVIKSLKKLN